MAGSGPSTFPSGARPPQPVVSDAAASAAAAAMSTAAAAAAASGAPGGVVAGGGGGTAVAPAVQPRRPTAEERRRRRETLIRDFFSPPLVYNRYRVEKVVGEGAYGVVCAATDTSTGRQVAVKRIRRVLDSAAMATRVLRELKFGRVLSAHENVISVLDVLVPGDRDRFNDVFVVFELMPTDLSRLLRSKTVLHEQHLQFFMFQLLRGLHFVHAANVMHRDLNPNNILVNNDCQLRICDFGTLLCDGGGGICCTTTRAYFLAWLCFRRAPCRLGSGILLSYTGEVERAGVRCVRVARRCASRPTHVQAYVLRMHSACMVHFACLAHASLLTFLLRSMCSVLVVCCVAFMLALLGRFQVWRVRHSKNRTTFFGPIMWPLGGTGRPSSSCLRRLATPRRLTCGRWGVSLPRCSVVVAPSFPAPTRTSSLRSSSR